MPVYQVKGVDPHGREFEKRVEASKAQAAAERFRRQGCTVSRASLVSSVQLERECHHCGLTNGIETIRCKSCRATLRGRTVNPAQRIALPAGYRVLERPDGTIRVDKLGWFWWRRHLAALLILSFMMSAFVGLLLSMAGAPDWAFIVLFVATAAVTLPWFGWVLFGSRGWRVTTGAIRTSSRLLGCTFTQEYTNAAFRLERRISTGYGTGSPRRSSWCVGLETLQDDVTICLESTPERARPVAMFLAQKTGWPLDDCLERQ